MAERADPRSTPGPTARSPRRRRQQRRRRRRPPRSIVGNRSRRLTTEEPTMHSHSRESSSGNFISPYDASPLLILLFIDFLLLILGIIFCASYFSSSRDYYRCTTCSSRGLFRYDERKNYLFIFWYPVLGNLVVEVMN